MSETNYMQKKQYFLQDLKDVSAMYTDIQILDLNNELTTEKLTAVWSTISAGVTFLRKVPTPVSWAATLMALLSNVPDTSFKEIFYKAYLEINKTIQFMETNNYDRIELSCLILEQEYQGETMHYIQNIESCSGLHEEGATGWIMFDPSLSPWPEAIYG